MFEYLVERIPLRTRNTDAVNVLGKQGWQIVEATATNMDFICLLEREIQIKVKKAPAKKKEDKKAEE